LLKESYYAKLYTINNRGHHMMPSNCIIADLKVYHIPTYEEMIKYKDNVIKAIAAIYD